MLHRRRRGVLSILCDLPLLVGDLGVDLFLMIEIIGHRGMNFRTLEMRIMEDHFIRRPAVVQVVHGDLRNPDARQPREPGRLAAELFDVRIGGCDGHTRFPGTTGDGSS